MSDVHTDTRITQIATMDHSGLVNAILHADCGFPVDFSADYLQDLSDDKLRHLYLALCLCDKGGFSRRLNPPQRA